MAYQESIDSIVQMLVEEFGEQKIIAESEDGCSEGAIHERVDQLVDAYSCAGTSRLVSILSGYPGDLEKLEQDLDVDSSNVPTWKAHTQLLVYEMLRRGVMERLESIQANASKIKLSLTPETNDKQLWFGLRNPPTFALTSKEKFPDFLFSFGNLPSLYDSSDLIKFCFSRTNALVFEGDTFQSTPTDLVQLAVGGYTCIRPRRVYTMGQTSIPKTLGVALVKHWVSITHPGAVEHKEILSKLVTDEISKS
jgi:hypothetical protein